MNQHSIEAGAEWMAEQDVSDYTYLIEASANLPRQDQVPTED